MEQGWERYLTEHEAAHREALLEYLRIPSISALPAHRADVDRAAEWTAEAMRRAGVPDVRVLPSDGMPVVVGRWHVADDRPTALIYGHYDVQPVDPLDLWESPPFEPAIRDGRVYARGSADMKGNLLTALHAVEAYARTEGQPPINVAFIVEGEEEVGSPSLPAFVRAHRDLLACDVVVSADGGMFGPETPSITVALKGLAGCQLDLTTGESDLHSGQFGAAVPNAARAIAELVEAGVPAGVYVAPVLPGLTDSPAALDAVAAAAREHGAAWLWASPLRLAPLVKEHYFGYVAREAPELLRRYERAYAAGANAPMAYRDALSERIALVRARYGFDDRPKSPSPPPPASQPIEAAAAADPVACQLALALSAPA